MDKPIKIKAVLEKKSHVLSKPSFYKDEPLLCFIPESSYLEALRNYFINEGGGYGKAYEVVIRPYPSDPTERARKHFFALRDRLAETMGDISKDHKEHLYRSCIVDCGFVDINYDIKDSIRTLSRAELWQATELMMDWLSDAEAYVVDLKSEHEQVKKELEDEDSGD